MSVTRISDPALGALTAVIDREAATVTVSGSGVIDAVLHRSPGTPPRTDVPISTADLLG